MATASPLSVSQALNLAKSALEQISTMVIGEVSEVSDRASYKAVYFTIADEKSAMPCLIWKNVYDQLGFKLQLGMLVEVQGKFGVYAPKGQMNFVVSRLNLAGEGALRQRVAQLAQKLQAEGLIDPSRRRPLPYAPKRIGLVTSPNGKAVHDVLRTLKRRWQLAEVVFAGVAVEGVNAAKGICAALELLQNKDVEIILLVRGGGSYEDLMPFNDEALARTIAASCVPVVTGIGHEPDNSIADMVADLRASTPTAAAEASVPQVNEIRAALAGIGQAITNHWQAQVSRQKAMLDSLANRPVLKDPMTSYQNQALALEQSAVRLHQAIALDRYKNTLALFATSLQSISPLLRFRNKIAISAANLQSITVLQRFKNKIAIYAASLHSLSPLAVLARGYAAVYDVNDAVLTSVSAINIGESISVRLKDGSLNCQVNEIYVSETSLSASDEEDEEKK